MASEEQKLNYDMLGFDDTSDAEKIAKYTGDVDWKYLKPHFKKGNLIYVDPSLKLEEVAEALVSDNKTKVQAWLKTADLLQPSHLHAEWWEYEKPQFTAVVIKPFVLAQPLESSAS